MSKHGEYYGKSSIKRVIKRDGSQVAFDRNKIEQAINKAAERDIDSKLLTDKIIKDLEQVPKVEEIQDVVENILVEEGHYKAAKSYILYRQEHEQERDEKSSILDGNTDEISRDFSKKALRILASRYLKKDDEGQIIESPSELFERVATHITIPDILYDKRVFDKQGGHSNNSGKGKAAGDAKHWYHSRQDLYIGDHRINKYTFESLAKLFKELAGKGQMKVQWNDFLSMFRQGEFDGYLENWQDYYDLMVNQAFEPNSPTLFNAGNKLGQLSACFKGDTAIDTREGIKEIKDISEGDLVLSHDKQYHKVSKTMEREGKLLKIKIDKIPPIYVTPDHPFMTQNGWKEVSELRPKSDFIELNIPSIEVSEKVINIDGVIEDDMVYERNNSPNKLQPGGKRTPEKSRQVTPIKSEVKVDKELAWVFGLYVAEGSISDGYDIRITHGSEERAQKTKNIINKNFGINSYVAKNSPSTRDSVWYDTRIGSKLLAQWVEKNFGRGFNNKSVPNWVLELPERVKEEFLKGVSDGDGSKVNQAQIQIGISNRSLAWNLFDLTYLLGYYPNLNKEYRPDNATEQPWSVTYGDNYNKGMVDDEGRYRVRSIEEYSDNETVYNLEVSSSHTYTANKASVHNCFSLPVDDDMGDIMDTAKEAALIFKSGGGVGINMSPLRPKGDYVASTSGVSSGPVSFMDIFDTVTDVVSQAGKRRGAMMGILNADHPDIKEFIQAKRANDKLENFNISVGTTEDFWDAFENDEAFALTNPHNGETVMEVDPESLLDIIAHSAWESADPGMIFFGRANEYNPMIPSKGRLSGTNPCSEQILYPYGSCNLGSINLESMIYDGRFYWDEFRERIETATQFLDNVISMNKFPLDKIEKEAKDTRRIGLGVMGLANTLYRMDVQYDSGSAYDFMSSLAEFLSFHSMRKSVDLAKKRGEFPAFHETDYTEGEIPISGYYEKNGDQDWDALISAIKKHGIRNSKTTTLPPTGSTAMIADTSHGIEPEFSLAYEKNVEAGDFYYANDVFEEVLREEGLYSEELLEKVANSYGTLQGIDEVPENIKDIFRTALDIHYLDHLMAQAVWQDWIAASISKTINMPADAEPSDVREAFKVGHYLGVKGLTVYRDKSKDEQVINMKGERGENILEPSEYAQRKITEEIISE